MADYAPSPSIPETESIYTVSRLTREVRDLLENAFPLLWIEGELSNIARPASGHLYFTLKDAAAQVRCAMFRMHNRNLGFVPEHGMQVIVRARVSLYEGRGDFQLIVEQIEPAGDGALRRAFEMLKQRLDRDGLFAGDHKLSLPRLPRCIGIISSATGAAVHDILTVLKRRFPGIPVILYPASVQGAQAAPEIARAIKKADQRRDCDVLVLARGGGSLEDLWAFNEEIVARAIYNCAIPLVTGIGHEIDTTIADLVADRRAPTPSAAAELVSPDSTEWDQSFRYLEQRLVRLAGRFVSDYQQHIDWAQQRLKQQHPGQRLRLLRQRLAEVDQRLRYNQTIVMRHHRVRLVQTGTRLRHLIPLHRLQSLSTSCANLARRLSAARCLQLEQRHQRLASLSQILDAVSPLATLNRGYAIVSRLPQRDIVRSSDQVQTGDRLEARLGQGRIRCVVEDAAGE